MITVQLKADLIYHTVPETEVAIAFRRNSSGRNSVWSVLGGEKKMSRMICERDTL